MFFKGIKKGHSMYSMRYGIGRVVDIKDDYIYIFFGNNVGTIQYIIDGREYETDAMQTLFWEKPIIQRQIFPGRNKKDQPYYYLDSSMRVSKTPGDNMLPYNDGHFYSGNYFQTELECESFRDHCVDYLNKLEEA